MNPDVCFDCGAPADLRHHVVPRSLGGTRTVPLCARCHGLIHDRDLVTMTALMRQGVARRRAEGKLVGNAVPYGIRRSLTGHPEPHPDEQEVIQLILQLRRGGFTLMQVAGELQGLGLKNRRGNDFPHQLVLNILRRYQPDGWSSRVPKKTSPAVDLERWTKEAQQRFRVRHRERIRLRDKQRRLANIEEFRAKDREAKRRVAAIRGAGRQ